MTMLLFLILWTDMPLQGPIGPEFVEGYVCKFQKESEGERAIYPYTKTDASTLVESHSTTLTSHEPVTSISSFDVRLAST